MIKYIKSGLSGFSPMIEEWDEPIVREYCGKTIEGRKTRAFGNSNFEYAGRLYEPTSWSVPMQYIKKNTEKLVKRETGRKISFSFCLCGYYGKDGKGIPHHTDTVPTLNDLIVSISFGAPRIFQWRQYKYPIKTETNTSERIPQWHKTDGIAEEINYMALDGDVFIFDGHSQMTSTHAVLDIHEGAGERINLTFRTGI